MQTPPSGANSRSSILRSSPVWTTNRPTRLLLYCLYAFACWQFTRCYLLNNASYLNLNNYIAGLERLPYQRRILPMLLLRGLLHFNFSPILTRHFAFLAHPALAWLLILSPVAIILTGIFATLLYRAALPLGRFPYLVAPLYLFCAIWTYNMRPLFGIWYPYDCFSQAFFAAGLLCIYTRRFIPLALIIAVGTWNRETTLFLVFLFAIDALAANTGPWLSRIPWFQTVLLLILWTTIKVVLSRMFVQNNASEQFSRLSVNLRLLLPDNYPQLFSACGFLLPILWLLRRKVPNSRLAAWLYILPIWIVVMLFAGRFDESRIFGELCPLVAVIAAALFDAYTIQNASAIANPVDPGPSISTP